MNNMLEYMTGGQCYKCGGKVRYDDGGNTSPQGQQSAVADMTRMQQPMRPPSALDASAKQLMKFLLEQLDKGTSERILKKTLVDSGIKRDQATELLEMAKQEYMKLAEQGDYVNEQSQQEALQQQQQIALQQQMGMLNNQDPMGMMSQAGPQSGQDQSQIALNQSTNQQQISDQEMATEARYGGSMKRLRRFNFGGDSCPDGYNWDDMTAQCRPTAVTANTNVQGAGGMNIGNQGVNQNVTTGMNQYNQNVVASAQASDARNSAQSDFYANQLANYDAKRAAQKDATNQAIGSLYGAIRNDQSTNPQNNIFQSWQNINKPQVPTAPVNQGYAQYGGLNKFVNARMKQYSAGGTEDGCPKGYYKGADGTCLKIFGSDQSKAEYQNYVNWYNESPTEKGYSRAPQQSYEEWNKENPAQNEMVKEAQNAEKKAKYQDYVDWYNESPVEAGYQRAPHQTYEEWEKENYQPQSEQVNPGTAGNTRPVDPRLTNSPYIVMSDKNKIANIDSNWATRAMAVGNSFADPRFAPIAGGFGPGLKFLMGAASAASGLGLGIAKMTAGNESRVYDDKGNVFFYNNKRDERRALNQGNDRTVPGMAPGDLKRDEYYQTNYDDQSNIAKGIDRKGRLVSYQDGNPPSQNTVQGIVGPENQPVFMQYSDSQKQPATGPGGSESGPLQSDNPAAPNYNPNVPKTGTVPANNNGTPSMVTNLSGPINDQKRDGGEWNPFVDNRRKLNITMPIYDGGGAIDTETTPYSQQDWANKTGRPFPLNRNDWDAYNNYVANFNNPSNANGPSNGVINTTDNTNNALSANPNANMTNTKEYTTQTGDPLGFQVASDTLQGFNYMNDAAAQWQERKSVKDLKNRQQQSGNTMMANNAINTQGSAGTWNLNAGPGANQYVSDLGHTQDWGTTLGKFGGTKMYRKGGTYNVSPEELRAIIQMGGEVEFLD